MYDDSRRIHHWSLSPLSFRHLSAPSLLPPIPPIHPSTQRPQQQHCLAKSSTSQTTQVLIHLKCIPRHNINALVALSCNRLSLLVGDSSPAGGFGGIFDPFH